MRRLLGLRDDLRHRFGDQHRVSGISRVRQAQPGPLARGGTALGLVRGGVDVVVIQGAVGAVLELHVTIEEEDVLAGALVCGGVSGGGLMRRA